MDHYLKDSGGKPLEALVTIEGGSITLHSRSGRARRAPAGDRGRNPDYVAAFDAIFSRLNVHAGAITRVLLDSTRARAVPEEERLLADSRDFDGVLHEAKNLVRRRMRAFGRDESMPANEGNQNKKIRIDTSLTDGEIRRALRVVPAPAGTSAGISGTGSPPVRRLSTAELRQVGMEHVMAALSRLDSGERATNFDLSRDYDAMRLDGRKYAPKHLFGFALEDALGIEAKPGHFSAGWNTPCFEILEDCGMWIVPRPGAPQRPAKNRPSAEPATAVPAASDEERTWIEGNPRMVQHMTRERQPGLAARKRAQFVSDHGQMFCERCGFDPVKVYGPDAGLACIEVHHHRTHVADMGEGHETSLDDLKCLCANCHRVLHRALTLGVPFDV